VNRKSLQSGFSLFLAVRLSISATLEGINICAFETEEVELSTILVLNFQGPFIQAASEEALTNAAMHNTNEIVILLFIAIF
jgi:hypothetical protein